MFSWRIRRQWGAFALVCAGAGLVIVFFGRRFIPAASCFDNRQNRGETGLDCGGPCESCELKNPKPLAIFWTRVARAGPGIVDAAAFVENQNETLASQEIRYEFTLFDTIGIIGQKTGVTFIYPQERLLVVEPGILASRDPVRVEFKVTSVSWQLGRQNPPSIVVEERSHSVLKEAGKEKSVVEATLFNASPYGVRGMETAVAVFDEKENLIGVNKIVSGELASGVRVHIRSIWPKTFDSNPARIEVDPRVNLASPDAIIRP